ncbi:MAG: hypothetical protein NWF05_10555 [Candidatus Bathyarchaeota archaeon]|nr:hypothetical protein [Candidatus Bathyarchaeota archaeon]
MSRSSPARVKALKAALIAVEASAQTVTENATAFVFQYNPEKLVRTLAYLNPDGTPVAESSAPPTAAPPVELIYLTLELDAADQLERPEENVSVSKAGLHPALATLESMMSPTADPNAKAESKIVLFFWGTQRLLPTRIVSMKVTEEAFDLNLNPIRANIDLCMRVLPLSELKGNSISYNICKNHKNLNTALAELYRQSVGNTVLSQVADQTPKTSTTKTVTKTVVKAATSQAGALKVSVKKKSATAKLKKLK